MGFEHAHALRGGFAAWVEASYPLEPKAAAGEPRHAPREGERPRPSEP